MWSLETLDVWDTLAGEADVDSPDAFYRAIQLGWNSVKAPPSVADSLFHINTCYADYTMIGLALLFDKSLSEELSRHARCPIVTPRVARYYDFDIKYSGIHPTAKQSYDIDHGHKDRLLGPIADQHLVNGREYAAFEPANLWNLDRDIADQMLRHTIDNIDPLLYAKFVDTYGILMVPICLVVTDTFFEALTKNGKNPFVKAVRR